MDRDAIHDPDEEQQDYPVDAAGLAPVRIGRDGDLEPAELEDPSGAPPHGSRLPVRGKKPRRSKIDWRPHDRGYDVD